MSFYSQPNYYQSLLGISSIDAVNSNTINTQNITTQNLTVSSLGSGLVSSATGVLQNAIIGTGLSYSNVTNTLNNTGLTSITSGATGPVYISTSSTGSVHIALPQNLTTSSSPQFARLLNSSIGTFNVIQGTNTGNLFTGDRCVLIGDSVMSATSSSQQSTAIGNSALGFATGNFNTAVGANAGFVVTSGTTNTILGTNAGRGATPLTTGSGNVLLGAGANTSSGSSSNEIVIGFGVGAGSNTAKIYASNGLNVSNLNNGVLKATSGTITSNATTDDLTEGKTNLYYTDTRARGAFTAGTGIDITSGLITNKGVTSITSGQTGPVYISTSSTGSVQIALPQNLTPTSGVEFFSVTTLGDVNSGGYLYSGGLSGGGTNNSLAVIDEGTIYSLGGNIIAPIQYSFSEGLRLSLTGSTGIDYTVRGNTGYISNTSLGPTGPTGAGGTIGFYANYYSTTTQSIGTSAQQITFPNYFVQNGISLDGNNNIVFSASGTYKITTLLQVNGSNNARFHHWYRYNGADVGNSAFEDHFSSGSGQVLSTSSGLITVNAGDTLGLWGVKTAGTIDITYTPGSVSPVYPASTSVNIVVSQETYTQIGPTGYTGPMGPTYTAGTNINVSGSNVISTVTNPQFERVLNSTLALRTVLLGNSSGGSITSGGVDCVGVGHNTLSSLTTGGSSTACGSQSLRNVTTGGSNTACGFNALNALQTGSQNTAVGAFAGSNITTGSFNTLMGMSSGGNLTTGSTNFHLGLNSGLSSQSSNDNISIGAYSMARNLNKMTGPDGRNLAIGHYSSHSLEGYPTNNISIGYNSLYNATQASDNIAIGTNALNSVRTGGGNIAIGGSSTTVGNLTGGQGLNIGLGIASNLYLTGASSNNIGIGGYSNLNTSSGNNNISIGTATQASTATSSNEITISTNGTISFPVTGRGPNTCLIDARAGLHYYATATCFLYAYNFSNNRCQWANFATNNPINNFTLGNYGNGADTVIIPTIPGLYQIDVSGTVLGLGGSIFGTWNNVNIRNYTHFLQSFSTNGIAYQVGFSVQSRPYIVPSASGFELQWTGATLHGGLPVFVSIRFISL